ncbi:DMT family transporter [bacterium]|nr:DMT family transporter [bacterium]
MEAHAGEIYAVLSGLFWGIAVCLFKRGGADMPALSLNLFKNLFGVGLFAITLPIVGQSLLIDVPISDYVIIIASGLVGMTIGDTLFFAALKRMGASLWAIISALYAPSVILMAYFVLDEKLTNWDIVGVVTIVGAIVLASVKRDELNVRLDRNLIIGIGMAILSLLLMAAGIVMMKPVLSRTPLWWAIQVRLIGATVGLIVMVLISKRRNTLLAALLPTANWKYILPGSFIGPYLALGFWIAGFKYTLAGCAAILNQLNMVFIFVFSAMFLKEPITWRRGLGFGLAMLGAALVILL